MVELLRLLAAGSVAAAGFGLFVYVLVRANRPDEAGREAGRRIAAAFDPEADPRLRAAAELDDVHTVNEHGETGEDVVVPAVTVPLAADDPDMDDVGRLTADAVREIHPVYRDRHVRHYDVQFEFGAKRWGGLGSRECRRMAVPPDLADELIGDTGYGAAELLVDLEDGDDGDDVTPPVYWGECENYTQGGGAAAATAAGAAGAT